ncbi:epoxide hydrolase family protein [uncultured Aquimarina sp.]|uniref:epoxide hydrolase family protein n=1 Tax=uncultured Aquimarina sp. TaxID=575652 RepID=UPI0026210638|nr:epoxide hydrolase family protein [uncultured Aquimarina sp.]
MINPFEVNIPKPVLDDLRTRLSRVRWPDEINNSEWNYGTSLDYMKELCNYWLNEFSWRKTENTINSYPNYIGEIDGNKIHFLHIKGEGKKSIPLIITHGWPGSFLEIMKLIPLLTKGKDVSFDLVIPSVIGFGFSSKCIQPGCDNAYVAGLWHKLMLNLGYEKYGAQGGDIGSGISTRLAMKYPNHVIGLHLNYISDSFSPYSQNDEENSKDVNKYKKDLENWASKEAGYAYIQATKPITLAYGLNDSPIGLCAWIVEKLNSWSDNKGQIESVFTKDEILSNVTLYWVTQTIHSSIRIYNENSKNPMIFRSTDFVPVPVAYANFPEEISRPPRAYAALGYNITRWTDMPSGGHFAAMEKPVQLASDIKEFFNSLY